MWSEKGTRPRAIRQVQYEFAYIFGAVCPERDLAVALVAPDVGIDGMLAHLKHISEQTASNKIAVIVMDRAPWHITKKINIYPNIRLIFLPPASPELNPVEQLWQQLRDNSLANRTYENYADIEKTCCSAWLTFTERKNAITSLCTRSWARIND